jgi:hypothetical protein
MAKASGVVPRAGLSLASVLGCDMMMSIRERAGLAGKKSGKNSSPTLVSAYQYEVGDAGVIQW